MGELTSEEIDLRPLRRQLGRKPYGAALGKTTLDEITDLARVRPRRTNAPVLLLGGAAFGFLLALMIQSGSTPRATPVATPPVPVSLRMVPPAPALSPPVTAPKLSEPKPSEPKATEASKPSAPAAASSLHARHARPAASAAPTEDREPLGEAKLNVIAPDQTKLWIDRQLKGEAPFEAITVSEGHHRIRVKRGAEELEEAIEIPAFGTVDYRVRFSE